MKFPKSVVIEVFRGGTQTDSSGKPFEWTDAKLDQICEKANKLGDHVPGCVSSKGHPDDNRPAVGHFSEWKRVGHAIKTKFFDIHNDFAEMLRNKTVKKLSIALKSDLTPRHVAFLGTMSPAVKKLEAFNFNENDDEFTEHDLEIGENEFAEFEVANAFHAIARTFQSIRDKLIEKDGVEEADKIIHQWNIDMLERVKEDDLSFTELKPKPGDTMDFEKEFNELNKKFDTLTTKLETVEKESKEFSETAVKEKTRADTAEKSISDGKEEAETKEFTEIVNGLVKANKITAGEGPGVMTTLRTLKGTPSYDFTDADGKAAKGNQFEDYKKQLDAKPEGTLFNEKFNKPLTTNQGMDKVLEDETQKIMDADGSNFTEASAKLRSTKPELFKGYEFTEVEE